MRIKVFKAADLKEAMAMVKDELGRDAVILHTKRYKQGGFLGYKSKEVVEVTAAVDDTPRRPRAKLPAMPRTSRQPTAAVGESQQSPQSTQQPQPAVRPRKVLSQYKTAGTEAGVSMAKAQSQKDGQPTDDFAPLLPKPILKPAPTVQQPRRQTKARQPRATAAPRVQAEPQARLARPRFEALQPAMAEPILPGAKREEETAKRQEEASAQKQRKTHVIKAETLPPKTEKPEQAPPVSGQPTPPTQETVISKAQDVSPKESAHQDKINELEDELAQMRMMLRQVMRQSAGGEEVATLKDALKLQELRDDVMQDIIRKIPPATMVLGKESPEAVKALGEYLRGVLKTGDGIGLKDGRPKIVALIGTTGVGKTTTIAKIAAKFVLERGISVALITADTYRISAVDQLRTYSDIIGLPLEIVYSPAELQTALRKHRGKKLILIDTAGRSQNNAYQMEELQGLLAADPSIEKHLVLSATTKERDAEAILERFAPCRPDRILLTKTDETESVGFIVNLLFGRRLALSYLTTGQSVPDDIEPAKPEALARLMLR